MFGSEPSAVSELTEPPSFALPDISPLSKLPRRILYERTSMTPSFLCLFYLITLAIPLKVRLSQLFFFFLCLIGWWCRSTRSL